MKKKHVENRSEASDAAETADDYMVGQVSGSLFQSKSASGSSSLSTLFGTGPSSSTLQFVPAPKLVPIPAKQSSLDCSTADKNAEGNTKKEKRKRRAAEEKLEDRESALKNADVEEEVKRGPKKAKRKAVGPAEEEQLPPKKVINRAEERIKNKRTVFVGNLPISCTKKMLKLLFKEFGSIESIRFRSVARGEEIMSRKLAAIKRKVNPNKPSINAYIVFKSEEEAVNALKRNGTEVEQGVYIRVDLASKANLHNHKRSIFVGNLPYDVTELTVRRHFERCGGVEAVRLVRDRNTGVGKGFGYVLFENADAVQLALTLEGSELQGRKVRVKRSVRKEKVKNEAGSRTRGGHSRAGNQLNKTRKQKPGAAHGGSAAQVQRKPAKRQGGASFRGEMAKPRSLQHKKNKGLKKKVNARKSSKIF